MARYLMEQKGQAAKKKAKQPRSKQKGKPN